MIIIAVTLIIAVTVIVCVAIRYGGMDIWEARRAFRKVEDTANNIHRRLIEIKKMLPEQPKEDV